MEEIWAYRQPLLDGTLNTVSVAVLSVVLAVLLGAVTAWGRLGRPGFARRMATIYTTVVRGIPDLCLMLLLYYGGQTLLNALGDATGLWRYIEINQFTAGVVTIGIIFGPYMGESFRGAYLSIPRGQVEAAVSTGMSDAQVFQRIIVPQLIRYALPSFGNYWMVLLKTTALVSILGMQDVVWQAFAAGRSTRQLFTFFLFTMVVYLVLTAISDLGLRYLERRYALGTQRATL